MVIYMNGRFLAEEQASVSIYDHGFMYGMGLFETMRTYGGVPFLWDRHLIRLQNDCERLSIAWNFDSNELLAAVQELLVRNHLEEAYLRLAVSAGNGAIGLPTEAYEEPNLIIYVKALPGSKPWEASARHLQKLALSRNTPEAGQRMKSFHYMNNILAKRELIQYPWAANAEGLFLDGKGFVAEGMVTNLFFVASDVLHTPHLDTGILPGITRKFIMDLAARLRLQVDEGFYTWRQLQEAEEVFLTNSVQGIVPVVKLWDTTGQQTDIGQGTPGRLSSMLHEQYQTAIKELQQHE